MSWWSKQKGEEIAHERANRARLRSAPPPAAVLTRLERFAELNEWVRSRNAWLVSVPGDSDVLLDVLPGSTVPDELAAQGYALREIGESQRILTHAVTEIVIPEEGSTPTKVTHSGIVRVLRYSFPLL